jgi:anti-sigma B factor antagonist
MDFNLSVASHAPDSHVTVRGELDLATAPQMSQTLQAEIEAGCRRMVIDLAGVTFVDATALSILAATHRLLSERGGVMTISAYPPAFLRLCRATGLVERFGLTSEGRPAVPV